MTAIEDTELDSKSSVHTPGSNSSSRRTSVTCCKQEDEKDSNRESPEHSCSEGHQSEASQQDNTPYHVFGSRMKLLLVSTVSLSAAMSGLATYMYFPAQDQIGQVGILPVGVTVSNDLHRI